MIAEETTILRGIERAPVTLTVYRCPRCKRVYTPRAERERLRGPAPDAALSPEDAPAP